MEFTDRLLADHGPELERALADVGFTNREARGFLEVVLGAIERLCQGDAAAATGGQAAGLLSQLDGREIGSALGLGAPRARAGLGAIAPLVVGGLADPGDPARPRPGERGSGDRLCEWAWRFLGH